MSHRNPLSIAFILLATPLLALVPGSQAPDFKGTDSNGVAHSLAQYRGKYVVLEWANKGCPYDQKHYLSGNMVSFSGLVFPVQTVEVILTTESCLYFTIHKTMSSYVYGVSKNKFEMAICRLMQPFRFNEAQEDSWKSSLSIRP